ncbi:DNA starvation/stationary phase protection protein [Robertkochia marina]|uniref:DNA starvation/stationary phase protection protein n=1 Tax=Robertkochia marina TaxID=1227945 RepID=A0A4S3LX51_9FLAO|nr:DNA starvation/stationary phase protection protein [Robertkochia marina]THD65498.1 DNA starvation/stationary phase protection protein [Robertkochia marina]TRZ40854.1 DNA starvation/stationary phase protection protein [Robertkochia marina]
MNYLNLDTNKTEKTVYELNVLLADYHLYYQKLRNFHWNILGRNFFDLHAKFEELYNDSKLKIDEIAERILTLRHRPVSNLSRYIEISNVEESKTDLTDVEMIETLLNDHATMLKQMRNVVKVADEGGDEGTIDLIGAYIRELEKTSWMLDAWRMKTNEVLKASVS